MVLKIFTADSIGTGVRAELGYGDILYVGEDATVARTDATVADAAVIRALAGNNTLDIRGTIIGSEAGILLGDNASTDSDFTVKLSSTAFVKSFSNAAIRVNAFTTDITNDGRIEGMIGIEFNGAAITNSYITNNGTIAGDNYGVVRGSAATETMIFTNNGSVSAKYGSYYSSDSLNAMDVVVNNGKMSGDVDLGGGTDRYEGASGEMVDGYVNGGSGNDTIYGGKGNEDLYGGQGADYLDGGAGGDYINGGSEGDIVFGGAGDDRIDGGGDADELHGGMGNDIYLVNQSDDVIIEIKSEGIDTVETSANYTLSANVENFAATGSLGITGIGNELANTLAGNGGQNALFGMAGNDTLDGGQGADYLEGGEGNDIYIDEAFEDTIVEKAGEGIDTVKASTSYMLSDNIETLILMGTGDIAGRGNTGANTLIGNSGVNKLIGLDGDDILDGKAGIDTLEGGKGNDIYIVDNSADIVTELPGEGTDTVKASKTYTLSANMEKLILTGTANINGTGSADANTLTGNSAKNTLKGMGGNDLLDGGAGVDRLEGGLGNDTYVVDNAGDVVVEVSGAGSGTDTVKASVSHTLSGNVENLILTGTGALAATGNGAANVLTGNTAKNTLIGLAGNDTLDGGAGADRLEGGLGNDTYKVDSSGDVVVELVDAGTDTVMASVNHTLSANVEKLALIGSANLNGTGNALANTLTGNAGNNILKGMAGNDVVNGGGGIDQLFGGAGKDMFVFSSAADSKAAAQDKIFDFSQAEGDRIDLKGVDANALLAGDQAFSFIVGSAFHKTAGELRFEVKSGDTIVQGDTDGNGVADFSFVLDTAVTLKAGDFLL
ncbi:calcium-binding protein [Shinella curvata]|uniref:Calcium-binding protein n=1 Tax=Shinella curvata TaxID=1817964 RepID=A0ABT8XGU0_9HYPH|nr:calcium-binding protein [Shinella curvata]MCJ8053342.1 calcium-binding protein [Shinella curvata]MDO6122673.1 calcium-binding protein [Shinella curvata]